jgi:2-(3-amino-3-carboxypropyl)histidine synthase
METMFIEARSELGILPRKADLQKLPTHIGVITTVQHAHKIEGLKEFLEENEKTVYLLKGSHSVHSGQALGCDLLRLKAHKNIEAFLYVGSGEFHPKELLMTQHKPVFIYNPESKHFSELNKKDVERIEGKRKAGLAKFHSAAKIGVLISVKPGQQGLNQALKLKEKYKDKEFYMLVADTLDFASLENFPFVECFVNTACPRIGYDEWENLRKPIINADDVL